MNARIADTKYVCGHCFAALENAECYVDECERAGLCYRLAKNLHGMWWVNDTEYMRDRCLAGEETSEQCTSCYNGNPDEHEAWSEAGPYWECEGCGDVPGMFAEVYKFVRLENVK